MADKSDRRSFLTRLSGLSAMALMSPLAKLEASEAPISAAAPWDLSWMDQLKGKHKQVFDLGKREIGGADVNAADETPLRVVRNYLNAHKEVFSQEYPDINAIVGITYEAFPMNASDSIWLKYGLGEKWKIKDPATGSWAVRNIFADPSAPINDRGVTIPNMIKRGVIFWQCNNALNGAVGVLAAAMKMEQPAVRAELIAGLMPGVHLVPAHTMAIGLVQEKGCSYEAL